MRRLIHTLTWAALVTVFSFSFAHAQNLHDCTADELSVVGGNQPPYWDGSGFKALVIDGVHYADFAYAVHTSSRTAIEYVVALRDTRADGKPPYLYLLGLATGGRTIQGPWIHNYYGAASGRWSCSHSTLRAPKGTEFSSYFFVGSVDNAPNVPEVVVGPAWE